jgi:hypothetical protein
MRYWDIWLPRKDWLIKKTSLREYDEYTEKSLQKLFNNQKRIWTTLGEKFEDPNIEHYIEAYSDNFPSNLNTTKQYYAVNLAIFARPRKPDIVLHLLKTKKDFNDLKTLDYEANEEQIEMYFGFETIADAKGFIQYIALSLTGDYNIIIDEE